MQRFVKRLSLVATCLLAGAAGVASGSGSGSGPTFQVMLDATHGVVPAIVQGPDGRMWFPETYNDSLGAITNAGVVTHYPTGVKVGQPNTIVVGPDRKLWYTLYGSAGEIGRMSTTGAHSQFSIGAVVNSLVGVGIGAGKSLWVGGEFSQLWHLSTSGVTVLHIKPPALSASRIPSTFVAGKDGRTWVNLGIFIAAVDAAGRVIEYKAGYRPNPNLRDMVLGTDGNIWFTDSEDLNRTGVIGRITPTGLVTEFITGLKKGSAPLGIAVGPDGNLWFTENAGGPHLDRITTDGRITRYAIPVNGSYNASGIARGQGRALWVTSNDVQGLVKVTIP
jgi:streptogramin lyase